MFTAQGVVGAVQSSPSQKRQSATTALKPGPGSSGFNYDTIPVGYYQQIAETGHPVRRAWHLQKFERVISCLPKVTGQSILDIGCFAGTFLSLLPEERFSRQLGVDILAKQVAYANQQFGTSYRSFQYLPRIRDLSQIQEQFDCITLIEVIEHLTEEEIRELFRQVDGRLKAGGVLLLSTPNYASFWPILEIAVNRLSDVSYEEQHITKFNYFTGMSKLQRISPMLTERFQLVGKATTHLVSPFLAAISFREAMRLSRAIPFRLWKNPFGNLMIFSFQKKAAIDGASGRERGESPVRDSLRRAA
jgi:2-polyprenyl-3-methyl-5-hydroxy-6-metoxy-1,4-benzoquinol methylase